MSLTDLLQSASNSAASNVTAPVDMIAWLLRKAGVDVREPVGGSDWAKRKGLMRDVPQSAASLGGETLGLLSPMLAAAKAPQIARGLLQGAENLAAPARLNPQLGATVWHGSPHKFDKFDSTKIGTGEGAQAYGHGLYLADAPGVAQGYKNGLTSPNPNLWQEVENVLPDVLKGKAPDWSDEILRGKTFGDLLAQVKPAWQKSLLQQRKAPLEALITKQQAGGNLYKVDLPDEHIAKMLDWDKPLSQQAPGVQRLAAQLNTDAALPGRALYNQGQLKAKLPDPDGPLAAGMSAWLREQGIPGIRYLDGGSRAGGTGTSNYVVFPGNEDLLKILERNGIPIGGGY